MHFHKFCHFVCTHIPEEAKSFLKHPQACM